MGTKVTWSLLSWSSLSIEGDNVPLISTSIDIKVLIPMLLGEVRCEGRELC